MGHRGNGQAWAAQLALYLQHQAVAEPFYILFAFTDFRIPTPWSCLQHKHKPDALVPEQGLEEKATSGTTLGMPLPVPGTLFPEKSGKHLSSASPQ